MSDGTHRDARPDGVEAPPSPPLHRFWWTHDARWYQGVARRYGQDVANEINREALASVARHVAEWARQSDGRALPGAPIVGVVEVFERAARAMWPDDMVDFHCSVLGEREFETVVTKNFALSMLRAAEAVEGYDCPCLGMRAGWFRGLGLAVDDACVECELKGGRHCRFRATVAEPPPAGD